MAKKKQRRMHDRQRTEWLRALKVGDAVYWVDPDEHRTSSGGWTVTRIVSPTGSACDDDAMIEVAKDSGECSEFFPDEIWPESPYVIGCAGGDFWSNRDGWVEFESATLFLRDETQTLRLPVDSDSEASWMTYELARARALRL